MTTPTLDSLRATTGLWTMTLDAQPVERLRDIVAELDELGFAALWLPEAWGREALVNASLALHASTRMTIATGIASIWARDAVAAVNGGRTLSAASNERFVLGLGVSHRPLVERLRGHHYESPLGAMRAYLEAMDAAPMHAADVEERTPRVIAALGPKMLELAASHADGAHTYLVTPEHTALARAHLGSAFLAVEQAVVLGATREAYLERAHAHLDFYTGLENYRNNWKRLGFTEDDFVRGGSERLCNAMVVHGDVDKVRERVAEHLALGADHVCLQVLGEDVSQPPLADWRALA